MKEFYLKIFILIHLLTPIKIHKLCIYGLTRNFFGTLSNIKTPSDILLWVKGRTLIERKKIDG